MSSSAAMGVGLIEESGISMDTQDHVTRSINDAVRGIGSNIVEKEVNGLFSGHGSV